MTLKTSLFNKGIYKNTLYRFKWGSFLYFIALFFMVPFALIVKEPSDFSNKYNVALHLGNLVFSYDRGLLSVLFAMAVPMVVATLVFHGVHSGKQAIFIHGLPVSRKANYISNLLASFTLMIMPVVLNGIILLIMSFGAYSKILYPTSVLLWVLELVGIIFVMFSVATLIAYLTGNAAACITIVFFVHLFPFIVYLAMVGLGSEFMYGFVYYQGSFADKFIDLSPLVYFSRIVDGEFFTAYENFQMWIYIATALILYFVTYFVYKFRKTENCGEVAAFKSFRALIKYAVVFSGAVLSLSLLVALKNGWKVAGISALIICAILYFACEMILSKSLKVFKSYKGFLCFSLVMTALISFFAFTGVFGYETRIPDIEKIEKASIGRGYNVEAYFFETKEEIKVVTDIHKEFVTDISAKEKNKDHENYGHICVSYELKNGKSMTRHYEVTEKEFEECMNKMYENKYYKFKETGIDNINIENVTYFNLDSTSSYFNYGEVVTEGAPEIFAALKKDIEELSYTQISQATSIDTNISLSVSVKENKTAKVFKKIDVANGEQEEFVSAYFYIGINGHFKNTINALKKYGYYDKMMKEASENMYICKLTAQKKGRTTDVSYKGDEGGFHSFYVSQKDCVPVNRKDALKVAQDLIVNYRDIYLADGEIYMLFYVNDETVEKMQLSSVSAVYEKDELPEYLLKYVE